DSDTAFEAILGEIRASIRTAIRDVMTCEPDYLVMGMSAETFWGGVEGNTAFIERVREQSGLRVSTGASACRAALATLGVKRIAAFSPYQPVADRQVRRFFEEAGFEVGRVPGLRCKSATAIASGGGPELRGILPQLHHSAPESLPPTATHPSLL